MCSVYRTVVMPSIKKASDPMQPVYLLAWALLHICISTNYKHVGHRKYTHRTQRQGL
jgi:hypothetical protein